MSRLIALDPDNQLVDEPEGFEYGYYAFDNVDPIKTQVEINEMTNKMGVETSVNLPGQRQNITKLRTISLLNCRKRINSVRIFSIC